MWMEKTGNLTPFLPLGFLSSVSWLSSYVGPITVTFEVLPKNWVEFRTAQPLFRPSVWGGKYNISLSLNMSPSTLSSLCPLNQPEEKRGQGLYFLFPLLLYIYLHRWWCAYWECLEILNRTAMLGMVLSAPWERLSSQGVGKVISQAVSSERDPKAAASLWGSPLAMLSILQPFTHEPPTEDPLEEWYQFRCCTLWTLSRLSFYFRIQAFPTR